MDITGFFKWIRNGEMPRSMDDAGFPESVPITDSPVVEESSITFSIRKHGNGKYSCKISQIPCEDSELDDYAKWLAGSLARSMMKFEELVGVDDPDGVANAKCPFSAKD